MDTEKSEGLPAVSLVAMSYMLGGQGAVHACLVVSINQQTWA